MTFLWQIKRLSHIRKCIWRHTFIIFRKNALNVLQYVGVAEKYQHVKGDGVIDCDGIDTPAEVHWFQEESVGRVEFKVKKWKKL